MDIVLRVTVLFAALFVLRRRPKWIAVLSLIFGLYFTVLSLWQGHYGSQFVGGEEVTGRIVDKRVEQDWTVNYFVTVAWSGTDGVEHSLDLKTMADFFAYYEAGQNVSLVLSKKSPELAMMKSDLKFLLSIGPVFFIPVIFFGLGGIGMAFFLWFYADRIRNYYQNVYSQNTDNNLYSQSTDNTAAKSKKWRWDDEP